MLLHSLRDFQLESLWYFTQYNNVVVCSPTGSGKSNVIYSCLLEFKVKAVLIVPIRALVSQHRANLLELGISSLSASTKTEASLDHSQVVIINPESIHLPWFTNWLNVNQPELLIYDECHTFWEWGLTFRPSFLNIIKLSARFKRQLWLSATISNKQVSDLEDRTGVSYFKVGSIALNENTRIIPISIPYSRRVSFLLHLVKTQTVLVFLWSKNTCDQLEHLFVRSGVMAVAFHSGLSAKQKNEIQKQIHSSKYQIIFATSAFGMGVDFKEIRSVVFWQTPPDWMSCIQMMGRAGRTGVGYAYFFNDSMSLKISPWLYKSK